jgi:transposase-like protein
VASELHAGGKVQILEEALRRGVIVKDVARRLGIHESLLYRRCSRCLPD